MSAERRPTKLQELQKLASKWNLTHIHCVDCGAPSSEETQEIVIIFGEGYVCMNCRKARAEAKHNG